MARKPVGIRKHPWGLEAYVKVRGRQMARTFMPGTPIETIRTWREDAKRQLRELEPQTERGTFSDDVSRFLAKQSGRRKIDFTIHLTKWMEVFGKNRTRHSIRVEEVRDALDKFQAEGGYSPSYMNKLRQALISLWKDRDGLDHRCPAKRIPKYREAAPEPRAVSPELIERVFASMPDSATKARLELTYRTGARPCEVARLAPERIHLDAEQPYIHYTTGKMGDDRAVPLTKAAVRAVESFVSHNAFGEFSESSSRRLFLATLSRVLKHDMAQAHPELTPDEIGAKVEAQMVQETRASGRRKWRFQPYVLRHTCLTEIRKKGADLADVQAIAGHKQIATTKRYAPTINAKLVAAFQRLEGE